MLQWGNLRDLSQKAVRTAEHIKLHQAVAVVKVEDCIGCDLCARHGHCYAIEMVPVEEKARHERNRNGVVALVDPYSCTGCHTCFDVCPVDCIYWEDVPEDRTSIPI